MEDNIRKVNRLRVAAYCRVSTDLEEQEGSFETQVRHYREKIGQSPDMELVGIYGDKGKSGLKASRRPELQRLLRDCKAGKIDLILTKSISRFARSMADCVELIRRLREWRVTVFFEREGLRTDDRKIDLIISILAAMAQEESHSISQNMIRCHEQHASEGRPCGRVAYGYARADDGSWQIRPAEAYRVRTAFRMAAEGRSYPEILTALNSIERQEGSGVIWLQRRVKYMLRNVAYQGDYYSHGTVCLTPGHQVVNRGYRDRYYIEEHHEPLVSRTLFERVQRMLDGGHLISYAPMTEEKRKMLRDDRWKQNTYERYIHANPEWEFAGLYADARSGLNAEKREGFMRMIEDAKGGKIDLILCKSISRFSRNIVECQRYTELLRSRNVTVIFEKEHIRTDEPTSSLIFSLMCAIAQDESRSISENMKTAIRHRVEAGVYTPRRNLMLGYDVKDGRFVLNADAHVIRHIFARYAEGAGITEICRELNEKGAKRLKVDKPFSVQNIQYILSNETYVGDKQLQKRAPRSFLTGKPDPTQPYATNYLIDDHEPIISREVWDTVQERLKREERDRIAGFCKQGNSHELYGRLFCASCGEPYMRCTFTRQNPAPGEDKHYKVWRCRGRLKGSGCKNPVIREDALKGILEGAGKFFVTAEGKVVAD